MALGNIGKLCSVHRDQVHGGIRFEWAKVCQTYEEAEMVECEFQNAAVPGQVYGVQFDGVSRYRPGNKDNLQIGYLSDLAITGVSPQHCTVRLRYQAGDPGGVVEFDFSEWSVLLAPDRHENVG